jgi:hypothetical protein
LFDRLSIECPDLQTYESGMRKLFIAFMMLALTLGQALAQAGMAMPSAASGDIAAMLSVRPGTVVAQSAGKRMCWRKLVFAASGKYSRPAVISSCGTDHKLHRAIFVPATPDNRQVYEAAKITRLSGSDGTDLLRPPIA